MSADQAPTGFGGATDRGERKTKNRIWNSEDYGRAEEKKKMKSQDYYDSMEKISINLE